MTRRISDYIRDLRANPHRAYMLGWVVLVSVVIGGQQVHAAGETTRTRHSLDMVLRQQAEGVCPFWRSIAQSEVPPNTSSIGRTIIRNAVTAYRASRCEDLPGFGPLRSIDPDAYLPPPPPPSGPPPSPTRTR